MDFKDFEIRLENINNTIVEFLNQTSEEEQIKIDEVFKILSGSINVKSSVLESLESQMTSNLNIFEEQIKKIEDLILNLETVKPEAKHNIELKKQELENIKQDELKNYLFAQKKKKSEVLHKISILKKELATFLKDNNFLLIEEEKNFKNRENELTRRLSIDLDRANEANVKEYSDLEKSLLETNDEKTIIEIKKKINSIRFDGIKEYTNIKNKYALSVFENNLEYKKFQEKVILDNSLKTEEYKIKIKTLDVEKTEIEDEETYTLQMYNYENDKKVLQLEKENELNLNQVNKEKSIEIFNNYQDLVDLRKKVNEKRYLEFKNIQKVVFDFDESQLQIYKPTYSLLSTNLKKDANCLTVGLSEYINAFKLSLISLLDNTWQKKKELNERFITLLFIGIKERVVDSDFFYKDVLIEIKKEIETYNKLQHNHLEKFKSTLTNMIDLFIKQISIFMNMIDDYQYEEQQVEIQFFKNLQLKFEQGYDHSLESNQRQNENTILKLEKELNQSKQDKNEKVEYAKISTLKIAQEYDYKLNELNAEIKQYVLAFKNKIEKDKAVFKKFTKNNKLRSIQLKKAYNENILKYEKSLYKKYKDEVLKNEIERKNKVNLL